MKKYGLLIVVLLFLVLGLFISERLEFFKTRKGETQKAKNDSGKFSDGFTVDKAQAMARQIRNEIDGFNTVGLDVHVVRTMEKMVDNLNDDEFIEVYNQYRAIYGESMIKDLKAEYSIQIQRPFRPVINEFYEKAERLNLP